MRRRLFPAALAALALAGCADDGATGVGELLLRQGDRLLPVAEPAFAGPTLNRAAINQLPYAAIEVRFGEAETGGLMGALSENAGYVTYFSAARQALVLRGGAVTGSRGLGHDLLGHEADAGDPVTAQLPASQWPDSVLRVYTFRDPAGGTYQRAVKCVLRRGPDERFVIYEVALDLARFDEECGNRDLRFANVYWIDAATGQVWRSRQWLGPEAAPVTIEVLRPFRSSR